MVLEIASRTPGTADTVPAAVDKPRISCTIGALNAAGTLGQLAGLLRIDQLRSSPPGEPGSRKVLELRPRGGERSLLQRKT